MLSIVSVRGDIVNAKIRFLNAEVNPDPLLSTKESIYLRIRLTNAGQRVELFH